MIKKIMKMIGYMPIKEAGMFDDLITISIIGEENVFCKQKQVIDYFYDKEKDSFNFLFRGDTEYITFQTDEIEEVVITDHRGDEVFKQKRDIE